MFLSYSGIKSMHTTYHSPWQNGICERTVGILKRELLDHIIPLNDRHLQCLLTEYVSSYYNPHRTHQGIERETPPFAEKPSAADQFIHTS